MASAPMYSLSWFDVFAATVPPAATDAEVAGIAAWAPPARFTRLLDLGCGIGRVIGPLLARGYGVTGIDTSIAALLSARRAAPGARYVALDQRHVGRLRWTFDVVVVLWNSFGFGTRDDDAATLRGIARVLPAGGRLLLDLYHPDWLRANERDGDADGRGAAVRRWVRDGRCFHEIRYADGTCDDIQFNVYRPDELRRLLRAAGFTTAAELVWWSTVLAPGAAHARYQLVCTRQP